jgi:hypothetical protein
MRVGVVATRFPSLGRIHQSEVEAVTQKEYRHCERPLSWISSSCRPGRISRVVMFARSRCRLVNIALAPFIASSASNTSCTTRDSLHAAAGAQDRTCPGRRSP